MLPSSPHETSRYRSRILDEIKGALSMCISTFMNWVLPRSPHEIGRRGSRIFDQVKKVFSTRAISFMN